MKNSGSLANAKLPEPIEALEPYKERLHIINGLHGTHTSPSPDPFFGALGGYRGGDGVAPGASTIDYELSKSFRKLFAAFMHRYGFHRKYEAKPTVANLSASGAGQPIFIRST